MNLDLLTPDLIASQIPNVLCEAHGETPIADKLRPYIEDAVEWLRTEYLGDEDFLTDAHSLLAIKIAIAKGYADALPGLDLVVTPSGMGVISTQNLTPASRDRVDRLVASRRDYIKAQLPVLIDICRKYPQWRASGRGRLFCSTFLCNPNGITLPSGDHLDFDNMRQRCTLIENRMSEFFLGGKLMGQLRSDYHAGIIGDSHPLVDGICSAEVALLADAARGGEPYSRRRIWPYARAVVATLRCYPEYYELWYDEMGSIFDAPHFVNDIKGGFYF